MSLQRIDLGKKQQAEQLFFFGLEDDDGTYIAEPTFAKIADKVGLSVSTVNKYAKLGHWENRRDALKSAYGTLSDEDYAQMYRELRKVILDQQRLRVNDLKVAAMKQVDKDIQEGKRVFDVRDELAVMRTEREIVNAGIGKREVADDAYKRLIQIGVVVNTGESKPALDGFNQGKETIIDAEYTDYDRPEKAV